MQSPWIATWRLIMMTSGLLVLSVRVSVMRCYPILAIRRGGRGRLGTPRHALLLLGTMVARFAGGIHQALTAMCGGLADLTCPRFQGHS